MRIVRIKWGLGDRVDATCYFVKPKFLSSDLVAGAYTFLNEGCYLCAGVSIGKYVMFGPDVWVLGGDHRFDLPGVPIEFSGRGAVKPTYIGDDVWVGARVMIRAGVKIGRGSIIAMGSVVVKDIPEYCIAGGNPCGVIRMRFSEDAIDLHDRMLQDGFSNPMFCGNERINVSKIEED